MPLAKISNNDYEKDRFKNNKTHKPHLPAPLHCSIFTVIVKRVLKKSSGMAWDEGINV